MITKRDYQAHKMCGHCTVWVSDGDALRGANVFSCLTQAKVIHPLA